MNYGKQSLFFFTLLLLGAVVFLGGCAKTGMDRSVKASNSIQEVDQEIRKMGVNIDATATSLDSLFLASQPDLKKSFDTYSKDVTEFEKQGEKVIKRVEEMRKSSTAYFSEWEKQGDNYTNPQIRQLSEDRRIKLAAIYARVPEAGVGIQDAYTIYLTDLKEIQRYLSNDLTVGGVNAISPIAKRTVQDLDVLKASIRPVVYALDEINVELYGGQK
ncbi:MAG: DUF2959 family protein [Desulfuromonadales bacterium]|nr:DUF2959 family protein [Desulfuromonadales bacterium]